VHNISDVKQIEVHMAEPLVPGPSRLEVEIAIAKLKKCKSPGSDQILAELIQARGEILLSAIHKLIILALSKYTCNRNWNSCYFILVFHNMFRPLRAILRLNTTSVTLLKCHQYYNGSVVLVLSTHVVRTI
jgi:hypothetical protein